jgi:hypothetical protein
METKAISIAKLTPLGVAVLLATSILLSINSNHAKGFGFMTAAGNTTAAGNLTKSAPRSQPLSHTQIPNTVPTNALDAMFQKCFMSHMDPIVPTTLNSMDIAFMEKVAIQNITGNVTGNTYGMEISIKPIIDCMKQEQLQPHQQQPYSFPQYQQPNNNYPLPIILSQSAYTDNIGTVHIVGEVINQSPVTAKFVEIIVTFYNAYNQVIGTDFTFTQPSDLAPGQRAPFDIAVLSGGMPMNQVRNYALTVDAS